MSIVVRTITTTMNPQDTVAQAETVAENLRSSGYAEVTVGPVYDNVTVKWYGMPSIDITYTVPDEPSPETPAEEPIDDRPEPMPVAELGGSPTATVEPEVAPDTAEPETAVADDSPAAAPPADEDTEVDTEEDTSSPEISEEPVDTGDAAPEEGTSTGTSEGEAY